MAATARNVDLSDVSEGGNFRPRRKTPGDYRGKIVKVDDHQPKDSSKPMGWVFTVQVDGDARSTYPYYVNPAPKEKWKIRQIMIAAGFPFNPKRIKFDPNKLVNKAIGMELEDDEYNDRVKSSIADLFPVSEVGASADEDAPEGDDEYEDDVEAYGDDNEDTAEVEDDPEPEPAPRRRRKAAPEPEPEDEAEDDEEEAPAPPPRRRRKASPEPEPEEDDDEDEVEETPAPRRRVAKKAAAPARKRAAAPVEDDDDLDLDDLDD